MSLKAFHVFFVGVAIATSFGLAVWFGMQYFADKSIGMLIGAIFSFLAGVGLVIYLNKFLHKLKSVSML